MIFPQCLVNIGRRQARTQGKQDDRSPFPERLVLIILEQEKGVHTHVVNMTSKDDQKFCVIVLSYEQETDLPQVLFWTVAAVCSIVAVRTMPHD